MVGWQGTGNVEGEESSRNLDGKSAVGKCPTAERGGNNFDYISGLKAIKMLIHSVLLLVISHGNVRRLKPTFSINPLVTFQTSQIIIER